MQEDVQVVLSDSDKILFIFWKKWKQAGAELCQAQVS